MAKILVHNYVKEFPDYFKVVRYDFPRYVGSDDVSESDDQYRYFNLLDENTFYRKLPRSMSRLRSFFLDVPESPVTPPVLNATFPFFHDIPSERLWEAYLAKKRLATQPRVSTALEDSVRRSRRVIKELIYSNPFDMWVTFTFAHQVSDLDVAKSRMSQWFKDQQKQYGSFGYLAVPELHKKCEECARLKAVSCPHDDRPKPVHFHALLMGYKGVVVPALSPHTGRQLRRKGRLLYNIQSFERGFTTLEYIDSTSGVSRYISKYITKETPVMSGKRRFLRSRGLSVPKSIPNHPVADSTSSVFYKGDFFSISYVAKSQKSDDSLKLVDIPF